jgi:hypothetical protein
VFDAHVGRQFIFQLLDFGAHNILAVGQDPLQPLQELRQNQLLLGLEVDEGQGPGGGRLRLGDQKIIGNGQKQRQSLLFQLNGAGQANGAP